MTSSQNVQLDSRTDPSDVEKLPGCAVCDHEMPDHDPISRRYCQATQAQALTRRCICSTAG
jgi:hypothetical protein